MAAIRATPHRSTPPAGGRTRAAAASSALIGAVLLLAAAAPARAQEQTLRGPILESEINAVLLPGTQGRREADAPLPAPAPRYRPVSPGALTEEETEAERDDAGAVVRAGSDADDGLFRDIDPSEGRRTTAAARAREAAAAAAREPAGPEDDAAEADDAARQEEADARDRFAPAGRLDEETFLPTGPTNEPVAAIGRGSLADESDPYAPVGLRLGTFDVTATLEQGLTWNSNPDYSEGGPSAVLSETTLRLNALSDWSRHSASVAAYGTYRQPVSGEAERELIGGLDARLDLDLAERLSAFAALAYERRPESASSPVVIAGVDRRPIRQSFDASLGVARNLGRLDLAVTGSLSRDQYGRARLDDGTELSQTDRNATLAALTLRGGYAVSPALAPFVELELGRRLYDEARDSAGYARSATRYAARAGVALDLQEKLTGEVAAGWVGERYDDARLGTIGGLALAASLDWSPQRGTTVGLDGATEIEGTTDPGDAGSVRYSGTLTVERALRANLDAVAQTGLSWRDYTDGGRDLTWFGQAELTWWLNRHAGVTGRLRHERQTSTLVGRDYDLTTVFLGLRLQR